MIQITVSENTPVTKIEYTGFGGAIETPLNNGDIITVYLKAPVDLNEGISLVWQMQLLTWEGDYTEKDSKPNTEFKQIGFKKSMSLFNSDGSNKYPFTRSEKDYIFASIEDQNKLLVEFLVSEGFAARNDLSIVGI